MKTLFDHDLTLEEAKELIKNGANVNEIDDIDHSTPIFNVTNIKIAKLLIDNSAKMDIQNKNGEIALFYVSHPEIAELMIAHGADINHTTTYNNTVLHYAQNHDMVTVYNNISKSIHRLEYDLLNGTVR